MEEMEEIIGIIVFVAVFIVGLVAVLVKAVKGTVTAKKQAQTTSPYNESNAPTAQPRTTMTYEQRRKLETLRQQQQQRQQQQNRQERTPEEQHERHQQDAHEHAHVGEEEHYDEIVGSLGDISDEGCEDLNGVRFIMRDLAYETDDEQTDYTKLVQSIVIGEIINMPKFKRPRR